MSIGVFETGDTRQFTWTSCVAPDAKPVFGVVEPFSGTTVASLIAGQSSTVAFYAFYTMPASLGIYLYTWTATKTLGSSVYPFVDRGKFRVEETHVA